MRGGLVGASKKLAVRRPCAQRQVKSPDSALVADTGVMVSQSPICFLRFVRSRAHPAASRSIRKFIALFVCAYRDIALLIDRSDCTIRASSLTGRERSLKNPALLRATAASGIEMISVPEVHPDLGCRLLRQLGNFVRAYG
jgi:hypothetical protein